MKKITEVIQVLAILWLLIMIASCFHGHYDLALEFFAAGISVAVLGAVIYFSFNTVSDVKIDGDMVEFVLGNKKMVHVSKSEIKEIETTGTGYTFYLADGKKLIYRYMGGVLFWKKDIELDKMICPKNFPFTKFDR